MNNLTALGTVDVALTAPILVCTLVSTYYGIDVLLGDSELAYNDGIVGFFGYSMPIYLFYVVAALLLAKRLKSEAFTSLPEILLRYYGPNTQILAAIASFLYSLPALSLFGWGLPYSVAPHSSTPFSEGSGPSPSQTPSSSL